MIDFFTKFPAIPYPVDGYTKYVANIVIAEIVVHRRIDSSYILWKKELLDGDTPISISEELYKTTKYYWTIFYINNVVNPYIDWFLSQSEVEAYSKKKYTSIHGLHHFEKRVGDNTEIIDDVQHKIEEAKWIAHMPQGLDIFPVTNIEYEKRINDTRRSITIISPKYISEFANEFQELIGTKYDNR